jgi:hypothetical protein
LQAKKSAAGSTATVPRSRDAGLESLKAEWWSRNVLSGKNSAAMVIRATTFFEPFVVVPRATLKRDRALDQDQ